MLVFTTEVKTKLKGTVRQALLVRKGTIIAWEYIASTDQEIIRLHQKRKIKEVTYYRY